MKKKFKIVRRGSKWCVRVNPDTDVFDREAWPAHAVAQWLEDYGIPYEAKKREYITIRGKWFNYDKPAKWKRDYIFECKDDVTWFLMQWT